MRGTAFVAVMMLSFGVASAEEYPHEYPVEATEVKDQAGAKTAGKKQPAARAAAKPAAEPVASQLPKAAPKLPPPKPELAKADTATSKTDTKPVHTKTDAARHNQASGVLADIPFSERMKIQAALLWSGDYAGTVNGEDPLLTAVKNYQKRIKSKVTGVLTPSERANLIVAARSHEQEFGWSVVVDPVTGIRIGLPTKLVPNARDAARGTRWSSAYGEVQVETFRIKDPNLTLAALFEQQKKTPATRKIEHSVLNDDNFFVSGMQGLKKFSVRAKMRDGEVRGFTLLFDQMMETIVAPVMVAMASSFSPFPERSAPFAALAKSVEYGNGLVVSSHGHIITDRRLTEGCQVIVADDLGDADRVAEDKDNGLALLRIYGRRKLTPLALVRDAPRTGDVTLVGIPDPKAQGGAKKLTEIKARITDGAAIELRQPVPMAGFSGAAALDGQGRFVGMTEMRSFVLASTEPTAPPVRLIGAAAIRDFVAAHGVDAAHTHGTDARASVVRIICVRK